MLKSCLNPGEFRTYAEDLIGIALRIHGKNFIGIGYTAEDGISKNLLLNHYFVYRQGQEIIANKFGDSEDFTQKEYKESMDLLNKYFTPIEFPKKDDTGLLKLPANTEKLFNFRPKDKKSFAFRDSSGVKAIDPINPCKELYIPYCTISEETKGFGPVFELRRTSDGCWGFFPISNTTIFIAKICLKQIPSSWYCKLSTLEDHHRWVQFANTLPEILKQKANSPAKLTLRSKADKKNY